MKRTLSSIALLAALAALAATAEAQTSEPYGTTQQTQATGTTDPQSGTEQAAMADPATTEASMPATAGEMPLIGLAGLAMLAAGLSIRSRRRA